jgi:hypothetical protein
MKITLYILITLSMLGCNTAISQTNAKYPIYFSETLSINRFLKSPIKDAGKAGFESQLTAKWTRGYSVYFKKGSIETKKTIIDCKSCSDLSDSFSKTEHDNRRDSYLAKTVICKAIQRAINAKPSLKSNVIDFKLNEKFARMAPPTMAIIISQEAEERAKNEASWFDMAEIKSVEQRGNDNSIYRDSSGGFQNVKLFAKGDFNNDGVEDVMVYVESSVEGGSYSTSYVFILTRFDKSKKYQLIEKF